MSIFTKLKTATDFSASVIKEGFALIWPEKKSDGSVALQVKLEDGSVQEIGGGSAGDIDAAVRIYDATVASETGVITITDGTPVTDLRIGDEIRTPDGVYQKIKDSTTTEGPADGTRIEVSGITSPAEANGVYILTETPRKWKHESADYWILVWQDKSWMISPVETGANPGYSLFYGYMSSPSMPWEVTSWDKMAVTAAGTPVVENAPAEQVITNTIDLFEYASLPVEPENIVQSVNGNKPDASGNVTIETGSSIDESRLLPENPGDGDVPVFNATATTGGGNDETVKLLIQPSTSENQIVDSAAGNVVPVSLSIEGDITVSEEGIMQFTQSQTISVPMAFSTVEMITGNSEWCLDFEFIPPTDLNDDNEFWSLYNDEQSYVGFWRGSMGDIVHMPCFGDIPGFTRGEKHLLTFEQWKDGETWKLSGYRNGSIGKTVETLIPATTSQDISFGHGNKRKFKGQIVSIRFRNVAPYRGTSFQPDATPYTVPQIVGAWRTKPVKELMSDAVDESRLLPDPSTLSSNSEGNVVAVTKLAADVNTIRLMHFNADFSDSVTGDSPVATTNVSLQEPGKFGKSLHFDGNPPGDFYYPALSSSPEAWTIDFWIYLTQYMNSQAVLFVFGTVLNEADVAVLRVNSTGIQLEVGYQSSVISGGESVSLNEWHHLALTYSDNTYKCYLDGNLYASQSSEKKVYFTKNLWLGSYFAYNGDHTMRGMIDEFRISNIVRWNSNFTPPDKEYEGGMLAYAITDPDEIMSVDSKIATHNADPSAHPDKLPLSGGQMTGELKISASNALRLNNKDGYGVILRKDANKFYILATAQNDENGAYTESRPLEVNLATGGCDISGSAKETESNLSSTGVYPSVSPNTTTTGDFNTYKTQGNYWFELGVRPNGPLGNDAETTGVLSVYNIQNTHTLQVYNLYRGTNVVTQQMYYRWYYNGTWSKWIKLSGSPTLITNPDYNQVTQTGTYYMSTGSGSQNAPDQSSYMLTVLSYKETSWERIFQTAVRYVANTQSDKQAMFTRIGDRTTAGGEITWTNWSAIESSESIGTTSNDYNTLTTPGDYYLSFGQNTSNLNAPANGPFHVLVHRYQNAAGTAKPILQIAASQIVSETQTPMMFFRSASYADSAWTFQPWLRLLTEKDVTYNTGPTGATVTKNDYIKIGNVIVYIGSVNLMLNSGTGFALPVLSNHMTFVASCNTYGVTITKLDIFLDSSNDLNVDISGTRSEAATDDQVDVGWIGIGYLN